MKTSKQALIILWEGAEPQNSTIEDIANVLLSRKICEAEALTIVYKDENGINNALLKSACNSEKKAQSASEVSLENKVKIAVVYIKKRFEAQLNNSSTHFAVALLRALREAHRSLELNVVEAEDARALLNAVEIIIKDYKKVHQNLDREYRMSKELLNIITDIYNYVLR